MNWFQGHFYLGFLFLKFHFLFVIIIFLPLDYLLHFHIIYASFLIIMINNATCLHSPITNSPFVYLNSSPALLLTFSSEELQTPKFHFCVLKGRLFVPKFHFKFLEIKFSFCTKLHLKKESYWQSSLFSNCHWDSFANILKYY